MKMNFKTLDGTIGMYVLPITVNSDFIHKDVRRLFKELNYCIRVYKILPATAINVQHLWYNITMIIKHYSVKTENRKDETYIEILKSVDKIKKVITNTDDRSTEELKQEVERLKTQLTEMKQREAFNNLGLTYKDENDVSTNRTQEEYIEFFIKDTHS